MTAAPVAHGPPGAVLPGMPAGMASASVAGVGCFSSVDIPMTSPAFTPAPARQARPTRIAVSVDVTCSVSRVTPAPVAVSVTTRMTGGDGVTDGEAPAGSSEADVVGDPEPPPSVDVVDGVGSALLLDGTAVRVATTDRLGDADVLRDAEPLPDREPDSVALGELVATADTLQLPLPLPVSDGLALDDTLRDGVAVSLPVVLALVDELTLAVVDAEMEPDTEPVTL